MSLCGQQRASYHEIGKDGALRELKSGRQPVNIGPRRVVLSATVHDTKDGRLHAHGNGESVYPEQRNHQ